MNVPPQIAAIIIATVFLSMTILVWEKYEHVQTDKRICALEEKYEKKIMELKSGYDGKINLFIAQQSLEATTRNLAVSELTLSMQKALASFTVGVQEMKRHTESSSR